MDQRVVILNVVCLFSVLVFFSSVTCFGRYMFLLRKLIRGRININRYEMHKRQNRRTCNKVFWLIVAITTIVGAAMEFGQFYFVTN